MEDLKLDSNILDLAIIGGGPAGAAAALEANRQGLRTAMWDRSRFPRDKVCGEFVSSEAIPLLRAVIPDAVVRGAVIRRAEFICENGVPRAFRLPSPALGLSRRVLDTALWEAATGRGIETHEGESVRSVRKVISRGRQANMWEIESAAGSVRSAKALIVACGRWWRIDGLASPAGRGSDFRDEGWVGAKAHFAGIQPLDCVEMYLFRGGYCGLAPVEAGVYNVCCLVRRIAVSKSRAGGMDDFCAWLVRMSCQPALEARLRGAVQITSTVTTAPVYLARGQAIQGETLMAGDASGFLDPFTGEGMSVALHSGTLAAQAIAKILSGERSYEQSPEVYVRGLARAVRRSYRTAAMARGLIDGPAWLQGLATAPLPWIGKNLVRETRWRKEAKLSS